MSRKSESNGLWSVEWEDRFEIVNDFPHIKIDDNTGELYVIENGVKKLLTMPYAPHPTDKNSVMIMFKSKVKKRRVQNGKVVDKEELEVGLIDRLHILYKPFVDSEVKWKLQKQQRGKEEKRKEIRALKVEQFISVLEKEWKKWKKVYINYNKKTGKIDSNLPLHKIAGINCFPNEMKFYSRGNKKGSKFQIDHFNNDTYDNRHFNLRICFNGENSKPEIDKSVGLNNFVLFYDKDEKGEIIERNIVIENGKVKVKNDNKKYAIICKCNEYMLENEKITKHLIEFELENGKIARAEVVMFLFDTYKEMKAVVNKVRIEKKTADETNGNRLRVNEVKKKRNEGIATALDEMLTAENIKNKKVFAFAESAKYMLDNELIGLVDVCRIDEKGEPLCVGVQKRRTFKDARGVEVGDYLDEKNIIDLFYYDIEKYIK